MIINPKAGEQYTMKDLDGWFSQAQKNGETLEIYPCNPMDAKLLWTRIIIKTNDDVAVLTQWLGGIPAGE